MKVECLLKANFFKKFVEVFENIMYVYVNVLKILCGKLCSHK